MVYLEIRSISLIRIVIENFYFELCTQSLLSQLENKITRKIEDHIIVQRNCGRKKERNGRQLLDDRQISRNSHLRHRLPSFLNVSNGHKRLTTKSVEEKKNLYLHVLRRYIHIFFFLFRNYKCNDKARRQNAKTMIVAINDGVTNGTSNFPDWWTYILNGCTIIRSQFDIGFAVQLIWESL